MGESTSRKKSTASYQRYFYYTAGFIILMAIVGIGLLISVQSLRPDLLPQHTYYDLIAHRQITERLVDPKLLKVEQWEILGLEQEVLFVHPAPSGSTALVYPVMIEPHTTLWSSLAVAPGAWTLDGDGVTFSVYIEDETGIHLVFSRYIDPKHHQQDRNWLPIQINLSSFENKLVRLILTVGSGPAGDRRNDWAGWGEPILARPIWP
jgi:hypothetical protein